MPKSSDKKRKKKSRPEQLYGAILQYLQRKGTKGGTVRGLRRALRLKKAQDHLIRQALHDLLAEERIYEERGRYFVPRRRVQGRLQRFKEGFGFLLCDDGPDIFIPPHQMKNAMNGDIVLVEVLREKKRPEGRVVKILKRGIRHFIGTYRRAFRGGYVEPDVFTLPRQLPVARGRAEADHKVVFKLTGPPKDPRAVILEDLGHEDDPSVDIKVVLRKYDLPEEFPKGVLRELRRRIPDSVADLRRDLRDRLIFTIDPRTAKDFDDAISVEATPDGGYRLGVHIADVSAFVAEGSALDREALKRGTSVYLLDHVVPMLPHELSGDLCSLRPGEDRWTLSLEIRLDPLGRPRGLKIFPAVIHSRARLTYQDAQRLLEGKDPQDPETEIAVPLKTLRQTLKLAHSLYQLLRNRRIKRGGLDFDLPEPEIALLPSGEVLDITEAVRLDTHRMIEEFMVLANNQVATYLSRRRIPTIYRIHEPPKKEKFEEFLKLAESILGRPLPKPRKITPKFVQHLLQEFEGKPEEKLINYLLLRSLAKARYSVENVGHFGLALKQYLHFTSPIRRYPDLMVHRIVKHLLLGEPRTEPEWVDHLEKVARQSSEREEVAQHAEFELLDIKKMEFMKDRVGEVFEGVVTHITPYGFFVEITKYLTEGFVSLERIPGKVSFVRETRTLWRGSEMLVRLGSRVRVQVEKVDKFRKSMDLHLVEVLKV